MCFQITFSILDRHRSHILGEISSLSKLFIITSGLKFSTAFRYLLFSFVTRVLFNVVYVLLFYWLLVQFLIFSWVLKYLFYLIFKKTWNFFRNFISAHYMLFRFIIKHPVSFLITGATSNTIPFLFVSLLYF